MARLIVVDLDDQTRVPFLRGILTRSLQKAGLTFERSYKVASQVRDEIADLGEITTADLRKRVLAHLKPLGTEVAGRYRKPRRTIPNVLVESTDGHRTPYSRGRHSLDLLACGLTPDEATPITDGLYMELMAKRKTGITTDELRALTADHIIRALGDEAAERYQVWQDFRDSRRPLVILIGGAVGSGKSTIATELAHRLDVVRIQSTDMLREVLRTMISRRLLPALHESTFTAWTTLPPTGAGGDRSELLEAGYLAQADLVSVAVEGVIKRAIRERVPLILEGVHIHPAFLDRIERRDDVVIVPLVLAVLKRKQLKERIAGRSRRAPSRRAERYLKHFDEIWQLQSALLAQADQAGVPIIANEDRDATVHEAVRVILEALACEALASEAQRQP